MDMFFPPRSTALLIWELTEDKGRGLGSWKSYSAGLRGTSTSHLPQPTGHSPCAQSEVLLLQILTEARELKTELFLILVWLCPSIHTHGCKKVLYIQLGNTVEN